MDSFNIKDSTIYEGKKETLAPPTGEPQLDEDHHRVLTATVYYGHRVIGLGDLWREVSDYL